MPFGQQPGPPASTKQTHELLDLLKDAGHADFRDARGPMGFTQRQAEGRFTRGEASVFIAQLQDAQSDADFSVVGEPPALSAAEERVISRLSSAQLAAELSRRGWTVVEPRR